jgi:hypothetical protein
MDKNNNLKKIIISESDFIYCIAGQLYSQAPNNNPRNANIILKKVKDLFRKNANNQNEFYFVEIEFNFKSILNFVSNILMEINEFKELNLSQIEIENNISLDDPNRESFSFVSRYDKYDSESWKYDFIDLDAFIRNVSNEIELSNYKNNIVGELKEK